MIRFSEDFYADVRIEENYSTNIALENGVLRQSKEKMDRGAMVRVFDGDRWYYGCTTDLSSVQQTLDDLYRLAKPNPQITDHPAVKRMEANQDTLLRYEASCVRDVPLDDKMALLQSYLPVLERCEQVQLHRFYYIDRYTQKQFYSSKGARLCFDGQNACVAGRYQIADSSGIPQRGGTDVFRARFEELWGHQEVLSRELEADLAFARDAVAVKPGVYTCVLSPVTAGVFAHESFGHKSESDFMLGDEAMRREWEIGKRVASPMVNIIDTGRLEGNGYVPYDDEGSRAGETYLIKEGILSGRLHNSVTAAALGEPLTGNARAVDFLFEPIVRMTTTYFGAGTKSKQELFEGIERGIYIDDIRHGSGMSTFTIAPGRAYLIENGKITKPVRVSVVTGNVMQTMYQIEGLSDRIELFSFALGGCGKLDQYPLPVGFGGPYVRVGSLNVQ